MEENKFFPVKVPITIAWGEMDAFGHLNNTVYFRYFETVRIKYFEEIGLLDTMEKTGVGPILAETRCSFKKPLTYPGTVTAAARIASAGKASFVMEYMILDEKEETAAIGEAVMVVFDYRKGVKTEIPGEIRKNINRLEEKELA